MTTGGKGDKPRPYSVPMETFDANWDRIFNKRNNIMNEQKQDQPVGNTCGCGRSPSGYCCGWHALSEEDYRIELAKFEDRKNRKTND